MIRVALVGTGVISEAHLEAYAFFSERWFTLERELWRTRPISMKRKNQSSDLQPMILHWAAAAKD
jgi:hypothetical protein